MLAYNFLFFYPFLLISTIISLILIYNTTKNFKLKKVESILILISTLPTITLLILVFINIFRIQNESNYIEETEKKIASENIRINDSLTINLEGYTYKKMRKKVTFKPNKELQNNFTSNQFAQGKYDSFFLFYKVDNDSLEIYIPEEEPLYFTNDGFEKLPIKVVYSTKSLNIKNLNEFKLQ